MYRKIFIALCLVMLLSASGNSASLWDDNANWFGDARPGRVGDIVTVLVNERTDAKDEATMDVQKSSKNGINEGVNGTSILSFLRGMMTFSTTNSAAGDGSVERKHHATATLACLVTEVLPNGNLVIEGTRDVRKSLHSWWR